MKRALAASKKDFARSRHGAARVIVHAFAVILSMSASNSGQAQQATHQPRPDPQQAEKHLDAIQTEQSRANRPAIPIPGVAKPEAPASTKPLFKLTAVSVEGAGMIPTEQISATYRSHIGTTVSQADLTAITGMISKLYRDAGYHLSRAIVPPQDIKGGRIRIQVIEGQIAEIVVKGNGAEQFGVRSLLDAVIDERPSRLKTLERQLLLMNDVPGVRVADTALEEIGKASGRFRLTVTVETWRIYSAQGLDNLGASAVGPLEAYSAAAFNSYFIGGDSLGVNLSTVPNAMRELAFGRLSYDAPVARDGARLGASVLYSDIWPGDERRQLDTHTQTETYELKGSVVPLETRKSSLVLTATADLSEVSERDTLETSYRDHLRIVGLTADYKLQDELGGWNYLTLVLHQGINVFGASQQGDALLSRSDASNNFSVLDFSATRYQKFSDIWSLKLAASGQWASAPLLTSQQFYLGGAAYGPGYYSGDNGIAGSVELRFDQTLKHELLKGYQLYGFMDRGGVWNYGAGTDDILSLSSVGAGVRFYLVDRLQAGVAIAAPVHYRTTADEVRDLRVLFSLSNSIKICPERAQMNCL
jgi:hemolysin activation/secretion protein